MLHYSIWPNNSRYSKLNCLIFEQPFTKIDRISVFSNVNHAILINNNENDSYSDSSIDITNSFSNEMEIIHDNVLTNSADLNLIKNLNQDEEKEEEKNHMVSIEDLFNWSNISVKEFYHFSKKEEKVNKDDENHEESVVVLDLTIQFLTLYSQSQRWFRLLIYLTYL